MVICPACGVRVQHGREDVHWREQVRETVERHKAKRRRERSKHDDDARQLSIFPEASEQDDEERAARARRAEIRARVEERLAKRRVTRPVDTPPHAGEVSLGGGGVAAAALSHSPAMPEMNAAAPAASFDPSTAKLDADELPESDDFELDHDAPVGEASLASDEPFIGFGLASPGERVLSGLIDLAFVSLIQLTLFYLTTHLVAQRLDALPTSAVVAMVLVGVVLAAVYFCFFWSLSGQTLGKLLTGGRVVDRGGAGALGVSRAALRLVGVILSLLPLGLGFIGVWTDTERRGWHDRFAGTKVVRG